MRIGKFNNAQLKETVLSKLKPVQDVLLSSAVGEDCAAIPFGDEVCVLSTDPITGACENIGELAVHVSGNDIASSGAQPKYMLVTILVPTNMEIADVEKVVDELVKTADSLGIGIIGGHTEVTDAVNRIVVSATVIGRTVPKKLVASSGASVGDVLIMTKSAGLEGTYILASERKEALSFVVTEDEMREAFALGEKLSVVKEGIAASAVGATAMHDVTEGGVLGAIHEMCEASGVGCDIDLGAIPVLGVTQKIAAHFGMNPYRLIGSGSMLIATNSADRMLKSLEKAGVQAAMIGVITSGKTLMFSDGKRSEIKPPEADELFTL